MPNLKIQPVVTVDWFEWWSYSIFTAILGNYGSEQTEIIKGGEMAGHKIQKCKTEVKRRAVVGNICETTLRKACWELDLKGLNVRRIWNNTLGTGVEVARSCYNEERQPVRALKLRYLVKYSPGIIDGPNVPLLLGKAADRWGEEGLEMVYRKLVHIMKEEGIEEILAEWRRIWDQNHTHRHIQNFACRDDGRPADTIAQVFPKRL